MDTNWQKDFSWWKMVFLFLLLVFASCTHKNLNDKNHLYISSNCGTKQNYHIGDEVEFGMFENGFADVKFKDWWGVVNNNGEFVLKESVELCDDDKLNEKRYIDLYPRQLFPNGKEFVDRNGKIFLVTKNGSILNKTGYDDAELFNGKKYTAVKMGGGMGIYR